MRVLIGIVIQIVAIMFIAEGVTLITKSWDLAMGSLAIGTALFTFSYFLLHDYNNKTCKEVNENGNTRYIES